MDPKTFQKKVLQRAKAKRHPLVALVQQALPSYPGPSWRRGRRRDMIKIKSFQEWALDYEKYVHYTQEFLKRNEDYRKDCLNLPPEEVLQKWGAYSYSLGKGHQATVFKPPVNVLQAKDKTLTLHIALEAPIPLLVHDFIDLIRTWKRAKRIREKKLQWDKLAIYLQILDLIKEGKNADEIAKIIYTDEYKQAVEDLDKKDIESLKRKVRKNIKRAKEIVVSGTIW